MLEIKDAFGELVACRKEIISAANVRPDGSRLRSRIAGGR